MLEYEERIQAYAEILQNFIVQYELPAEWFASPDHLALKCADSIDYDYTLQELLADAQLAAEVFMDQRRLAALHLTVQQAVGTLGSVEWLEIMEPRPAKLGKGMVGLEHMEFYYPDFDEITKVLTTRKVTFTLQANPGHAWVNIVLNQSGQELKLNNRPLADVVREELADGTAHSVLT